MPVWLGTQLPSGPGEAENKAAQDADSFSIFLNCCFFSSHKLLPIKNTELDQKPLGFLLLSSVGFRWALCSATCVPFCLWLVIKTSCLQWKYSQNKVFWCIIITLFPTAKLMRISRVEVLTKILENHYKSSYYICSLQTSPWQRAGPNRRGKAGKFSWRRATGTCCCRN